MGDWCHLSLGVYNMWAGPGVSQMPHIHSRVGEEGRAVLWWAGVLSDVPGSRALAGRAGLGREAEHSPWPYNRASGDLLWTWSRLEQCQVGMHQQRPPQHFWRPISGRGGEWHTCPHVPPLPVTCDSLQAHAAYSSQLATFEQYCIYLCITYPQIRHGPCFWMKGKKRFSLLTKPFRISLFI